MQLLYLSRTPIYYVGSKIEYIVITTLLKITLSQLCLNQSTNIDFDVIAVSEPRITKNKPSIIDISLPNYLSSVQLNHQLVELYFLEETIFHIFSKNIQPIHKLCKLKSTFVKTFNPGKTKIVIVYIYTHPNVNLNKFNEFYLNDLLDKP